MTTELRPVTRAQARRFIADHHRHSPAPVGYLFGVGLERDGELVGIVTAGRPIARALDDGLTIELTRVATLGGKNDCSRLYGAACRAAIALGYQRAITYTLECEPGTSPRAAGFEVDGLSDRGLYAENRRLKMPWASDRPAGRKVRWVRDLVGIGSRSGGDRVGSRQE